MPLSQPIKCKAETNHDSTAHLFLHFRQFAQFYYEFSIALQSYLLVFWLVSDYFGFGFMPLNQEVLFDTASIFESSNSVVQPCLIHMYPVFSPIEKLSPIEKEFVLTLSLK